MLSTFRLMRQSLRDTPRDEQDEQYLQHQSAELGGEMKRRRLVGKQSEA